MSSKLNVASLFDFDCVDYAKESNVHLDVVLSAPERKGQKRIPLHLILALDCSGSMSNGKLDSVKNTVLKLLEHATENDTVGILAFSENVWEVQAPLPMNSTNRETAKNAVQALHTLGSTNIEDTLIMAIEKAASAAKDQVSRIVLLTDGRPTCKACDCQRLVSIVSGMTKVVSCSTFGYGTDYDPELLVGLSGAGRGNHFFIQTDDDCRKAFALELGGLLSLFAQDLKVTLALSGNIAVDEFLSSYEVEQSAGYRGITGAKLSFTIPDIYCGEKKHAIIKLKVPQASEAVCSRPTRVCDISVEYLDTDSKNKESVSDIVRIQYVKASKLASEPNKEVREQLFMIEAAKKQAEAKQMADAGNYVEARQVLMTAANWASSSAWHSQSHLVAENFNTLATSCSDRVSYQNTGTKHFASYASAYGTARGSSGDTLGMSYTSGIQLDMLKSFSATGTDTENKNKLSLKKDDEEEKKA